MRKLKMFLKAQLAFLMVAFPALADKPVLTIYTYDSFISEWGPGPAIEKNFEAICACDVNFVGLDPRLGFWDASSWKATLPRRISRWGWIQMLWRLPKIPGFLPNTG